MTTLWRSHPAVRTDSSLTFGERAADIMKHWLATWTALIATSVAIVAWIGFGAFGEDASPYLRLNLSLSCFAALQCFVLLIAAKRADQIAAEVALHTLENTQILQELLEENTRLTRELHEHIAQSAKVQP